MSYPKPSLVPRELTTDLFCCVVEEAIGKILGIVSALVSCHRVDEFLREEETDKYSQHNAENPADVNRVGLENATFTWAGNDSVKTDDSSKFRLSDITLDFQTGGLSLIVGSVGSVRNQNNRLSGVCLIAKLSQGKSSLLHALLGEMTLLEGRRFLPSNAVRKTDYDPAQALLADSVAFCTQSPWLQNGTIRENILFGAPFNQARYETVLHACALHPDLAVLQRGDRTLVGEKGTVLSGGQKARISLARAVYSSAKTLLLDDILSAVEWVKIGRGNCGRGAKLTFDSLTHLFRHPAPTQRNILHYIV